MGDREYTFNRRSGFDDAMARCKSAELRQLYGYWQTTRADRPAPIRSDIRPEEIKPILPNILIIETVGDTPRLRYRLVGTEFVTIYGAELTGRFVDEADFDGVRDTLVADYAKVLADHLPSWTRWEFFKDDGRWVNYERLAMPLSSDGSAVNMLLVGVVGPGVSEIPVLTA